jgi:hypothetical protein
MRLTIYSWDLDVVGGGGWAISMREFAELFRDHGHEVRFIHSRVGQNLERGQPLSGPLLDESQWADADLVWIYESGNSATEIIQHIGGRKPIIVSWPTPILGWFEQFLRHDNVWMLLNSPTIEAYAARQLGVMQRVKTLPRGRRWSKWPKVSGQRDKIGLPFGLKALVQGDGTRPQGLANHSPYPRYATSYAPYGKPGTHTGLTPRFSAVDVAREIHAATGATAIATTWAPREFDGAPFVELHQHVKPYTAMGAFYGQCRMFVASLIWESFGVQPLEAQHYGVPVLYFREPDVQEPQLSFSAIGYTSLDHAVQAGERLIRDLDWWHYWSQKSRENAARFDLDRLWPEYEAFFQEVAGCRA